jgi:hypothetical protein
MCSISIFFIFRTIPVTMLSPACIQRGGGFTQAGGSLHFPRGTTVDFPHQLSDELSPRLCQTASYLLAFFCSLSLQTPLSFTHCPQ